MLINIVTLIVTLSTEVQGYFQDKINRPLLYAYVHTLLAIAMCSLCVTLN